MADGKTTCAMCGAEAGLPCRSTRDMEDRPAPRCRTALLAIGGGEYTVNRMEAGRWLAVMETALSAEPETWAQPVTARHGEGTESAAIFEALTEAGFAEVHEDGWRLTPKGFLAVTRRHIPWTIAA